MTGVRALRPAEVLNRKAAYVSVTAFWVPSVPLLALQMEEVISENMRSLPRLKVLRVTFTWLEDFPISVPTALSQLRELDLRNNRFKRIPAAVGKITTLQALNISRNEELELASKDLDTLAALSSLERLSIYKDSFKTKPPGRFSQGKFGCPP